MTRRIFRSIMLVVAAVLAACLCIILGVLYEYYSGISEQQMKTQTTLIARAVEAEGVTYLEGLDSGAPRVTWIAADGSVLFDTQTDTVGMDNHADREEFIEALEVGSGQSSRYSATLTERMMYCAERLSDGSVVRVANAQSTILTIVLGMLQPILILLVLAAILSAVLASRISKRIVQPLNALDLDAPLDNDTYEELSPLLTRIERQKRQLADQLDELRRRRKEWDTIAGSVSEGIVLLGAKGEVIGINKSAAQLLDTGEYCVGSDFLTVCRRVDIQKLLDSASMGDKAELTAELGGREYQINASPVFSNDELCGTALLFFDVTDKTRAEQLRREFTANVSHELKTPLHTISGSAEIMRDGLVKPEDMPRFIERIYSEAQRMITLVDDIIRLSHLDEGVSELPRESISLKAVACDVLKRLESEAQAKGVTAAVEGDSGMITGVPPLVTELVYNLCDNAIKYNKQGGSVTVSVADSADGAALTVSDTGIGIPPEAQDRVFERFYRVDKSHSKEIGGTGLGLSIVKHVARLHGASIELESAAGEGTRITVSFSHQPLSTAPRSIKRISQ